MNLTIEPFLGRLVPQTTHNQALLKRLSQQNKRLQCFDAISNEKNFVRCFRCQQLSKKSVVMMPQKQTFCPQCINMGRMCSRTKLWWHPEINHFKPPASPLLWNKQLSAQQKLSSQAIVAAIKAKQDLLVWAVTGAGKTEMVYAGIAYAILQKMRVAFVIPRIDVVIELAERLKKDFNLPICVLYGDKSTEKTSNKYFYSQLTVATTHQLLRFYEAFDVIIVDEVDAFPYHNNPLLNQVVKRAQKPTASTIFLSATPPPKLLAKVKLKQLKCVMTPLRFHNHLLPEPKIMRARLLPKPSKKLVRLLRRWQKEGWQFLVFVPAVRMVEPFFNALHQILPHSMGAALSAQSEARNDIIAAFRMKKYQYLVTTTILERGVTFADINVLVIHANHVVFDDATLIQIAGRAGRKKSRPFGEVIFCAELISRSQKRALKQIKRMNIAAKKIQQKGQQNEIIPD